MELLAASRLAARRVDSGGTFLFEGVDLRLSSGSRVGLVGPNGSGKSTLLSLLAAAATPDDGRVVKAPGVRTTLLTQQAGRELAGGSADISVWEAAALAVGIEPATSDPTRDRSVDDVTGSELREILAALGLGHERHGELTAQLSDGERQRLALAAVLAAPADVLLLDEPTNHLDLVARTWLEKHLVKRRGAVVIVSHDRELLDATTTSTAFLTASGLRVVAHCYSKAAKTMAAKSAQAAKRQRELDNEAARLERVAVELAAHGAKAQARRRKAVRDSAALRSRASRLSVEVDGTREAVAERARRGPPVNGRAPHRRAHSVLLEAEHLTVPGVLEDVAVRIAAGDRIALLGPNGSGKSTLLSLLLGTVAGADPRQRLWYAPAMKLVCVDQATRGLLPGVPVIDQGSARLGLDQARRVLAASGLPFTSWTLTPERLSGGERARVGLSFALAQPFDLLVLDEPDNDLDLVGVEDLEARLSERTAALGAALIVATHDRRLARSLADRAWSIRAGALTANGSVLGYLRGEAGTPASDFWLTERELPEVEQQDDEGTAEDLLQRLENERVGLVERLSDPLALTEREAERLDQRLAAVESQLMAAYDAALAPAAPRYRLVERGLTIYADQPNGDALPEVGEPTNGETSAEQVRSLQRPCRLVLVAEDDALRATTELAESTPGVPWLDVRLESGVAHLRLGPQADACLLPRTALALTEAGVRLAFTVLGACRVQSFSHDDLSGTSLEPVGGGWWRASLDSYLVNDGWGTAGAVSDDATITRSTPEHRGRRRRRKAVAT